MNAKPLTWVEGIRITVDEMGFELAQTDRAALVMTLTSVVRSTVDARDKRIAELKGAMRADDERLRKAGQRVGIIRGCDTAEAMADRIQELEQKLADAETVNDALRAGLGRGKQ